MEELTDVYGDDFLRFVLASRTDDEPLTSVQASLVAVLQALTSLASKDRTPFVRYMSLQMGLGRYVGELGTTVAWVLRMQNGGDLSEAPESSDQLTHSLLIAARDAWPLLLIHQPDDAPSSFGALGAIPSLIAHPSAQDVSRLALTDDGLKHAFVDTTQGAEGTRVQATFTTGSGHGTQAATLPGVLIGSAWLRFRLQGSGNISDYLDCVVEVLAQARELSRGREVVVPNLVGLTGVEIAEGVEVTTPFGTLRAPRGTDKQLTADRTDGAKLTAVLETTAPLRLIVRDAEDAEPRGRYDERFGSVLREYNRRTAHAITMARFAILLSSDSDIIGVTPISQTVFNPLEHGLAQRWLPFHRGLSGTNKLDASAAERVRAWAEKIHVSHPPALDLGMRRLLAAATTRTDPVDGFIDAVMCWENMFGASPETTFRVCGAMACLLEPTDKARRTALFDELKKLYNARSSVVHGSIELNHRSAYDHRTRAVRCALDAMRRLYDYPELLKIKKSHDRGRAILLDVGFGVVPLDDDAAGEPESHEE